MKNKLIYIITILYLLVICLGIYWIDDENKKVRHYQHTENKRYKANEYQNGKFQTHLPIIKIDTHRQKIPGSSIKNNKGNIYETAIENKKTIKVSLDIIDQKKGLNGIEDKPNVSSLARLKYRGNSSRRFDKKSYSIHLIQNDDKENYKQLAGMAVHDEWVLNGPFIDRSLLRNYLAMNITRRIMEYAPDVRYCELFVDGKYQGLYLLMETVSKGEGRINIRKPEKNKDITSYIICWDREGKGDNEIDSYAHYTHHTDKSIIDIIYPGQNKLTEGQKEYITGDISKIERVLYSNDFSDVNEGYTKYLDMNAFADYFIVNEFFRNVDAGQFSTYYYKDVRGRLKPCVWDFNNMCDNYMEQSFGEGGFDMINMVYFDALIKDRRFVTAVIDRYRQFRSQVLSKKYLLNFIDEVNDWLGKSVNRNYKLWGDVFDLSKYNETNYLTPVDRNLTSHKEAVDQLKEFIVKRGKWMDQHIDTLKQYCHESKNVNKQ